MTGMPQRLLRFVAPDEEVRAGFDEIRAELEIPEGYPEAAQQEAEGPPRLPETDLTDVAFITLDPAGSLDLDQAMHLERTPSGFLLRYAIADVAAFVTPGGALDRETRIRAVTLYAPDKRTPLHPFSLSEGTGSLLAGEDRPAVVWELSFDLDGEMKRALVRRAMVRSRAQLDYQSTQAGFDAGNPAEPLMALAELGRLRIEREAARGGVSLPVPEQRVVPADGGWRLEFREVPDVERWNAHLSLATGMAAGRMMAEAGVGVLRTLAPAPESDVAGFGTRPRRLGSTGRRASTIRASSARSMPPCQPKRRLSPRLPACSAGPATRSSARSSHRDPMLPWHRSTPTSPPLCAGWWTGTPPRPVLPSKRGPSRRSGCSTG